MWPNDLHFKIPRSSALFSDENSSVHGRTLKTHPEANVNVDSAPRTTADNRPPSSASIGLCKVCGRKRMYDLFDGRPLKVDPSVVRVAHADKCEDVVPAALRLHRKFASRVTEGL